MTHRYITVSYNLYADNDAGIHELLEQAPEQYPFQFITNMGMALDAFESRIAALSENEEFDFTLSVEEGYGPYLPEYVIQVPKASFFVNGKFAEDAVYPGSIIPLVNEEGMRFHGLVTEIKGDTVVVLEAMKMANNLEAEKDGKVTAICVKQGESVMEDTPLVVIE